MFPAASGLLLAACFPPLHLLVPPFLALVPFAVWVARLPAGADGAAAAARGGLLLGVVMHGLLLHWIAPALWWTTRWAPLALLFVVGLLAGLTTAFGWTLHRMVHRARAPMWLALPVGWTAMEWLQGHLPGPLAFPWLGLGTSLTGYPELVGMAELVGARGVAFWLALVSGVLATALLSPRRARARIGLALAAVVLAPAAWGLARARTLTTVPMARVAVVASDVPAAARRDTAAWRERASAVLDVALDMAVEPAPAAPGGEAVDLLVLPEGLAMAGPEGLDGALLVERARSASAERDVSILLGAYVDRGRTAPQNLAVLARPDGAAPALYRKRRLVPLVEWWPSDASAAGGSTAVAPVVALRDGGRVLGPLVCWEAIFPEAARDARLAGADLLVNVSNDAWFGASGGLGRAGREQHAAHLVMRAIEHRVGAVRSANGGASYVVDPSGRVSARLSPGPETRVATGVVRSGSIVTLYTRTGDLVGLGSTLLLVGLVVLPGIGRRARAAAA